MSPGPWQIILIVLLLVVFFGRGKISGMMGDVAKGIKEFKKGMADEDEKPSQLEDSSAKAPDAEKQTDKTS